jgi:hypothetical protein
VRGCRLFRSRGTGWPTARAMSCRCACVADKAVDRKEIYKARAVIINFNTLFHKRQAVIELKKLLQANPGLKATVSDIFPTTETP